VETEILEFVAVHLVFFLSNFYAWKAISVNWLLGLLKCFSYRSFPFHKSGSYSICYRSRLLRNISEIVTFKFSKLDDSGDIHVLVYFLCVVAVYKLPLR
jgi:hypothetical protein